MVPPANACSSQICSIQVGGPGVTCRGHQCNKYAGMDYQSCFFSRKYLVSPALGVSFPFPIKVFRDGHDNKAAE